METYPKRWFSGAPWEKQVGYCRAIRMGNQIVVSGTAPIADDGTVYAPGDPYRQTQRCFTILEEALQALGADRRAVVRTRLFVTDIRQWEEYGRAHREFFAEFPPTTSMVEVNRLIDPQMLVEVEADAYLA